MPSYELHSHGAEVFDTDTGPPDCFAGLAEDVRARKLTIANGEGVLHGRRYDLETQYGIRLTQAAPSG